MRLYLCVCSEGGVVRLYLCVCSEGGVVRLYLCACSEGGVVHLYLCVSVSYVAWQTQSVYREPAGHYLC